MPLDERVLLTRPKPSAASARSTSASTANGYLGPCWNQDVRVACSSGSADRISQDTDLIKQRPGHLRPLPAPLPRRRQSVLVRWTRRRCRCASRWGRQEPTTQLRLPHRHFPGRSQKFQCLADIAQAALGPPGGRGPGLPHVAGRARSGRDPPARGPRPGACDGPARLARSAVRRKAPGRGVATPGRKGLAGLQPAAPGIQTSAGPAEALASAPVGACARPDSPATGTHQSRTACPCAPGEGPAYRTRRRASSEVSTGNGSPLCLLPQSAYPASVSIGTGQTNWSAIEKEGGDVTIEARTGHEYPLRGAAYP